MVCNKCEKKLNRLATPDPWKGSKKGGTLSTGGGSGGAITSSKVINGNKLLSSKNTRFHPYAKPSKDKPTSQFRKCRICADSIHLTGAYYCQKCSYKKGICAMCGAKVSEIKNYVGRTYLMEYVDEEYHLEITPSTLYFDKPDDVFAGKFFMRNLCHEYVICHINSNNENYFISPHQLCLAPMNNCQIIVETEVLMPHKDKIEIFYKLTNEFQSHSQINLIIMNENFRLFSKSLDVERKFDYLLTDAYPINRKNDKFSKEIVYRSDLNVNQNNYNEEEYPRTLNEISDVDNSMINKRELKSNFDHLRMWEMNKNQNRKKPENLGITNKIMCMADNFEKHIQQKYGYGIGRIFTVRTVLAFLGVLLVSIILVLWVLFTINGEEDTGHPLGPARVIFPNSYMAGYVQHDSAHGHYKQKEPNTPQDVLVHFGKNGNSVAEVRKPYCKPICKPFGKGRNHRPFCTSGCRKPHPTPYENPGPWCKPYPCRKKREDAPYLDEICRMNSFRCNTIQKVPDNYYHKTPNNDYQNRYFPGKQYPSNPSPEEYESPVFDIEKGIEYPSKYKKDHMFDRYARYETLQI
ncbi:hypothetical protein SNEBB_002330 [Seison nebaliae]|nr:hypothetical protein SNEBB_002330 [Seison nebaliae]